MNIVVVVIGSFLLPPVSSWAWGQILRRWIRPDVLGGWCTSAGFGLGFGIFAREWWWAAGSGASLAVMLAIWWRRRRKRRRALALLGAKSRALIAAMVRAMRRERRPSRVLRPHPVPS